MTIDERLSEIRRLASLGQYAEAYEHRIEVLKAPLNKRVAWQLVEIRGEFWEFDLFCRNVNSATEGLLR